MACWTDEEIGARFGKTKQTISNWIESLSKNGKLSKNGQTPTFTHADGFTPPLYNICKTPYSIGKELSRWVEKLFDAKVSKETIKTRARRIAEDTGDSFDTAYNRIRRGKNEVRQGDAPTPSQTEPNSASEKTVYHRLN